jgi:hypothetical protein
MKFFRLDLLTLLISLFILNSCKNQDSIGLPAGSSGQIAGSLTDTATIFTKTVLDDSLIVTSGLTKIPMGFFKDPALGTTTANLVTDLNLPLSTAYTIPTGTITIDSAILILKYAAGFYGDSLTSKYKANVYQLGERPYSANEPYYGNRTWLLNSSNTLLGTKTFFSRTHDSLKVTTVVSGGPDTLIKVAPQLRIPIDVNFIRNIMFSSTSPVSSNLIFKNTVNGLYVNIDQANTTGAGGIFMLAAPADSSLEVHIRTTNGLTIDTSVVYLDVAVNAAEIRHNYSPQVLSALHSTKQSDTTIYLQGLAGLRTKISFPYIQSLFKSLGGSNSVVINRAEIVLSPVPGSDIPAYLTPQIKLSLYKYDIAHQRTTIEDATPTDPRSYTVGLFGGFYSPTTMNYHFLVTSYLQDLLNGKTVDYGTYIAPIDYTNTSGVDVAATPETAGRTVAVGSSKTSPYRIKLNVIYTTIPKQ